MAKHILFLLLLELVTVPLRAQTSDPPDCLASFAFTTTTGPAATFTNSQGCVTWTVVYSSTGFTGLSLVFQSAPGTTTPGAFVTYAGTVSTGVNPNIDTTGAVTTFSNGTVATPYVRMNLASITGSGRIQGVFYGWRTGSGGGGGGASACGTAMTPCVVIGPTAPGSAPTDAGVEIQGFDGTNDQRIKVDVQGRALPGAYPSSAAITLSASGLTQIIALSGSTVITLGSYSISFASAVDFQWEYGTGVNCGTGTTALTGIYRSILTVAIDDPIKVPAGQALCANLGTAVAGGGVAMYNQQ